MRACVRVQQTYGSISSQLFSDVPVTRSKYSAGHGSRYRALWMVLSSHRSSRAMVEGIRHTRHKPSQGRGNTAIEHSAPTPAHDRVCAKRELLDDKRRMCGTARTQCGCSQ